MTKRDTGAAKRWYDDACGTALAMELVGERWSLLVVRELMFGPRRFGELRSGLPGISANVLTQRLEGLETAGIVARRKLPAPASVQVYELTALGRASERAIQELGRWAVLSHAHDPTLPLSPASMMMSFRTMFDPTRVAGIDARLGFVLAGESFDAHLSPDGIAVSRGEPESADLTIVAVTPMALAAVVYGGRPLQDAIADGSITVTGDRALADRFVTLFSLPDKLGPA